MSEENSIDFYSIQTETIFSSLITGRHCISSQLSAVNFASEIGKDARRQRSGWAACCDSLLESHVFSGAGGRNRTYIRSLESFYTAIVRCPPTALYGAFGQSRAQSSKTLASVDKISTMELTSGRPEAFPSQDVSHCYAILVNHVRGKALWGIRRTRV